MRVLRYSLNPAAFFRLLSQTHSGYDSRRSSISSGVSSASWANNQARRGRLLYAPLILVDEAGGTQTVWGDTNGSASLPASARPGWLSGGSAGVAQQNRPYTTLRIPQQQSPGYMEKGSADSLVESVNKSFCVFNSEENILYILSVFRNVVRFVF